MFNQTRGLGSETFTSISCSFWEEHCLYPHSQGAMLWTINYLPSLGPTFSISEIPWPSSQMLLGLLCPQESAWTQPTGDTSGKWKAGLGRDAGVWQGVGLLSLVQYKCLDIVRLWGRNPVVEIPRVYKMKVKMIVPRSKSLLMKKCQEWYR